MFSRGKAWLVVVVGTLCGAVFSISFVHNLGVIGAPVVTGDITARTPIKQFGMIRVDFTIRIRGTATDVHAHAGRYLMNRVPATVRFRYAGDPAREVFLFEHEEGPHWVVLFCWGVAACFGALLSPWRRLDPIRRSLGWSCEPGRSGTIEAARPHHGGRGAVTTVRGRDEVACDGALVTWPFSDPRNHAAITLWRILRAGKPILLVSHDDDGSWQFLDSDEASVDDAAVVALEEMLRHDPTIAELADLPRGCTATRAGPDEPWSRDATPDA